jgi:hypothetical protein
MIEAIKITNKYALYILFTSLFYKNKLRGNTKVPGAKFTPYTVVRVGYNSSSPATFRRLKANADALASRNLLMVLYQQKPLPARSI